MSEINKFQAVPARAAICAANNASQLVLAHQWTAQVAGTDPCRFWSYRADVDAFNKHGKN